MKGFMVLPLNSKMSEQFLQKKLLVKPELSNHKKNPPIYGGPSLGRDAWVSDPGGAACKCQQVRHSYGGLKYTKFYGTQLKPFYTVNGSFAGVVNECLIRGIRVKNTQMSMNKGE